MVAVRDRQARSVLAPVSGLVIGANPSPTQSSDVDVLKLFIEGNSHASKAATATTPTRIKPATTPRSASVRVRHSPVMLIIPTVVKIYRQHSRSVSSRPRPWRRPFAEFVVSVSFRRFNVPPFPEPYVKLPGGCMPPAPPRATMRQHRASSWTFESATATTTSTASAPGPGFKDSLLAA